MPSGDAGDVSQRHTARPGSHRPAARRIEALDRRIAQDLGRQLRGNCIIAPPHQQVAARENLPQPQDEAFWGRTDGNPESLILLSIPRSFAATVSERVFGAPLVLRDAPADRLRRGAGAGPGPRLVQTAVAGLAGEKRARSQRRRTPLPDPGAGSWMRFACELRCGAGASEISISLSPQTGLLLLGEQSGGGDNYLRPRAVAARGDVPIELRTLLGEASFTLEELVSLRVGDVIALDRRVDEPVEITVGERRFFRARAGLAGKMVAFELMDTISEDAG